MANRNASVLISAVLLDPWVIPPLITKFKNNRVIDVVIVVTKITLYLNNLSKKIIKFNIEFSCSLFKVSK